jgi:hypothetical protein
MASHKKLSDAPEIWRLAKDLGLSVRQDPVTAIVRRAVRRVQEIRKEFPCATLAELLDSVAAKLDTVFVEVYTDADVDALEGAYLARGETGFVALRSQLSPKVFGITFRLLRPTHLDRAFVSVIDCRGAKRYRAYFTKWHEVAHLLTLTAQRRLRFCRSHEPGERKDPEEALMDVIAGDAAFLPDIVRPYAAGHLTVDTIDNLRETLCPECSRYAALLGFAHAWSNPVLLVEVELAVRTAEALAKQCQFDFSTPLIAVPRATRVTSNEAARVAGLRIHRNMRIPEDSVIHSVFRGDAERLQATENLSMWSASDGTRLPDRSVRVDAFRLNDNVFALVNGDT